ncbi:MAG TPA: GvpL/GvpF family gas vesicle protein [Solirubrobacteraceae bacterium]|nr:GvpL/GvpF family gas vesicle protein [Solirubrobacteraceae bacterium]
MTLLLYAIGPADAPVAAGLTGLGGAPVDTIVHAGLAAFVAGCDRAPEPRPESLLEYERIVERLMDDATILPARFGTVLAGETEVITLLQERRERFLAGLARVSGAVEFGVRADWSDSPPLAEAAGSASAAAGATPGLDYMNERLAVRRRAREIATAIDTPLRDLARERTCRILTRPQTPVVAAYLVARPHVDEFIGRCRDVTEAVAGATVVGTGPWPPYSFVEQEPT